MLSSAAPVPAPKPKLPVDQLVSAIELRSSWTLLRDALKAAKFPPGHGWKDLKGTAAESTKEGARLREFLREYFDDSLVAGERYVQIYTVEKELIKALSTSLLGAKVPPSDFAATYPLPLDLKTLVTAPSDPTLCELREHGNGDVSLIFCSTGYFDDRTVYEHNQLSDLIKKAFVGVDKMITVRKTYYQSYDVVTIRRKLERIEISVDQPSKLNGNRFDNRPMSILTAAALYLTELVGFGARPADNLFPAISSIYSEKTEGRVVSLAFRTKTGSVKREKMTSPDDDLRDERFHQAGMVAVGQDIKPYELEVEWEFPSPDSDASLKLHGLLSQVSSEDPTLYGCYVKAHKEGSLEKAINRLMTHIC